MKNIQTYELFEGRQTGVIYHYTEPEALQKILQEDRIIAGSYDPSISFSRNHNMLSWVDDFGACCRIAIDGDSLSDRYRISPHLYAPKKPELFSDHDKINWKPMSVEARRKKYGEEREERINLPEITGIKRYIIQVDILRRNMTEKLPNSPTTRGKEIISQVMDNNPDIQIRYVEKFTPVKI